MSQSLTIEPLGATIEVEEGQTLLDAALRQGIYIPHACGHGLCGTCKVQVSEGEVDHGAANPFALMDFERDEGKALACCATLLSDATIEADIEEDPDARVIPVRDFHTTVTRIDTLTPTIKAIWLQARRPNRFPGWPVRAAPVAGCGGRPAVLDRQLAAAGGCHGRDRAQCAHRGRGGRHGLPARAAQSGRCAHRQRALMAASSCANRPRCRCCSWPAAPACPARDR